MDYMLNKALGGKCQYCAKDLQAEEWKSNFDSTRHYKTLPCACGKRNWCKVPFDGSGHDSFPHTRSVESTMLKVREK